MPSYPRCGSEKVIKNGSVHNGKAKFSCRECSRQFVENPSNKTIPKETWETVDKLLLEKISAAGISRFTGISEVLIQRHVNKKYAAAPKQTEDVFFKKKPLILQCDEIWSFVGSKKSKVWTWLAIDRDSRAIAGAYAGSRDKEGARPLEFTAGIMQAACCV